MTTPSSTNPTAANVTRPILWFLVAAALFLRLEGILWPTYHPDEHVIAEWLRKGGPSRAYPGGFFTLARPVCRTWEQIEKIRSRFLLFQNPAAHASPLRPSYVFLARYINVTLGTLTCLVIYLAAKTFSGSRSYALISTALMAFSQYHIEHSHYGETDIAMIFALAVALATWLHFVRSGRTGWFFIAAFAMGCAGGTKFTLIALWPAVLIFPIIGKPPPNFSNVWKWRVFGALAAALLLLAGFVAATPAVTDWHEFRTGLASEAARVYGETRLNMGPLAQDMAVRFSARLHDFAGWSRSLGAPWLVLWAVSIPLLFLPGSRRAWIPFVLAPACYLGYWIFLSPWVRTQEFMVFLPFAAVTAPWAALYAWRINSRVSRTVAALACAAACLVAAQRGVRTASIFGWPDTRDIATRWLALCAPTNATYAAEKYAFAQPPGGGVIPIRMVLHHDVSEFAQRGIDFIFRNGAEGDRGTVHPVTGKRYEEFERTYSRFLANSERLRVFSLLPPPETFTTFNSIRIEIFGLPRYAQWPTVTHPLPQPAYLARHERWTYFPIGRHLGPTAVIELTPDESVFAIGGPDEPTSPIYAILYTRERPATVRLKGFGRRWEVNLAPYDARCLPLMRATWKPRWSHVEVVSARVVPQRHIYRVPCYLQLAFSRAEARRILHDLGMLPAPDFVLGPDPQIHLNSINRLEELANRATIEFGVGPNSAWYYDRFARLRITNDVLAEWDRGEARTGQPPRARIAFPIIRSPAPGALTFNAVLSASDIRTGTDCRVHFYEEESGALLADTNLVVGTTNTVSISLPSGRAGELTLVAEMNPPLLERVKGAELTWDIRSALRHEIVELRLALAEQLLARGEADETLKVLAALPSDLSFVNEIRRRRYVWQARCLKSDRAAGDAARALLDLAPNHLGALESVGSDDPQAAALFENIQEIPESQIPVRFHRFLNLRGVQPDVKNGTLRLLFECREDAPPPMVARVYERRHARWKDLPEQAVKLRPRAKGECFIVTLPMPTPAKADQMAFAVEADVQWHAGRLRTEMFEEDIIPMDKLLEHCFPE